MCDKAQFRTAAQLREERVCSSCYWYWDMRAYAGKFACQFGVHPVEGRCSYYNDGVLHHVG